MHIRSILALVICACSMLACTAESQDESGTADDTRTVEAKSSDDPAPEGHVRTQNIKSGGAPGACNRYPDGAVICCNLIGDNMVCTQN
jgi:hypothetical protein